MSRLRASRPGLLLCVAACAAALLYFRGPAREEPGAEPPTPAVAECGFYPDELCSALFEGKGAASQVAKFCKSPHGSEILAHLHAPGNCSRISRGLRFIPSPLSAEEGNFSLAYVLTVHKELAMFVQLLRAIYAPQNVYCVHMDERAPEKHKSAVQTLVSCFENVFISSKREKGAPPGSVRLQADLNCMEDLVRSRFQWNYVINLCGQDFPIKTNKEIIHYIRSKWNGKNITPGVIQPAKTKSTTSPSQPESTPEGSVYVSPNKGFEEEPPHNLTIYFGSAYYVLTREFVQFVLTDTRAKDMLQWSRALQSPERHYWVTLNHLEERRVSRGTEPSRQSLWKYRESCHVLAQTPRAPHQTLAGRATFEPRNGGVRRETLTTDVKATPTRTAVSTGQQTCHGSCCCLPCLPANSSPRQSLLWWRAWRGGRGGESCSRQRFPWTRTGVSPSRVTSVGTEPPGRELRGAGAFFLASLYFRDLQ